MVSPQTQPLNSYRLYHDHFFDMCCLFQPEPCPLDNFLLIIPTSDRKKLGASFWHTVLQITPYAVVICWYIDIDLGRILGGDIP